MRRKIYNLKMAQLKQNINSMYLLELKLLQQWLWLKWHCIWDNFFMKSWKGKTYLGLYIMWYVALESIIHVLFETNIEIFKALPLLSMDITNSRDLLIIPFFSHWFEQSLTYFSLGNSNPTTLDILPTQNSNFCYN